MADNVKVSVGYDDSKVITGLANLRSQVDKTNAMLAKSTASVFKGALGANIVTGALSKAWSAGGSILGKIKDEVMDAFDLSGNAEQTRVSLTTMLGSAEKANKVIKEAIKLADQTPYKLPEITESAKALIAFGEPAGQVIDTLRTLGDVASGVGAPIGEIAVMYGKARVQGRVFAKDLHEFTGRGIPVIQELAKQFGVSDSEVNKLVEDGKIGFSNLEKAMQSLTGEGGKFNGMMAMQSQTAKGLMSTLMDAWDGVKRNFAAPILEKLKPLLEAAISYVYKLQAGASEVGKTIGDWVDYLRGAFKAGDGFSALIGDLKLGLMEAANGFLKVMHFGVLATIGLLQEKNPFSTKSDVSKTASEAAKALMGDGPLAGVLSSAYSDRAAMVEKSNAALEAGRSTKAYLEQQSKWTAESKMGMEEFKQKFKDNPTDGGAAFRGRTGFFESFKNIGTSLFKRGASAINNNPGVAEAEKQKVRDKAMDRYYDQQTKLEKQRKETENLISGLEKDALPKTFADSMAKIGGGGNAVSTVNEKSLKALLDAKVLLQGILTEMKQPPTFQ